MQQIHFFFGGGDSTEFGGKIPDWNEIINFNQTSQKNFAPLEFA